MKTNYVAPEMEILVFATEDVIETSGLTARFSVDTPGDWFADNTNA